MCPSTYFWHFNLWATPLRISGGKKWAVDGSAGTMNGRQIHLMHTLKLQRRKKKHNIALVIDKDIQFQYQQRADRLDNVICWIFNSNVVCLLLRSTSVQLVCFSSGPNHRCDGFIHLSSSLAHPGQFTSTRLWEGDSYNHRRSVLKNRLRAKGAESHWHLQLNANITFLSNACSSRRLIPPWWHIRNAAARWDTDAASVFVTTKSQMQIAPAIQSGTSSWVPSLASWTFESNAAAPSLASHFHVVLDQRPIQIRVLTSSW